MKKKNNVIPAFEQKRHEIKQMLGYVFEANFSLQLITFSETHLRKFVHPFLERNKQVFANRRFNTVKPVYRELDARDIDSDEE